MMVLKNIIQRRSNEIIKGIGLFKEISALSSLIPGKTSGLLGVPDRFPQQQDSEKPDENSMSLLEAMLPNSLTLKQNFFGNAGVGCGGVLILSLPEQFCRPCTVESASLRNLYLWYLHADICAFRMFLETLYR